MVSLFRALILKVSAWPWVERMVRRSRVFRGLVARFIAGDTLDEAMAAAETLHAAGFLVTLDFLGESTHTREEATAAKNVYCQMLHRISESPCAPATNISIKLTQCGLDVDREFAMSNYREVLELAREMDIFVRIDMESSDYTQKTIDAVLEVFPEYANTGTVLQTYLKRTPDDVETMIRHQIRTRLVKGAYLEPPDLAYQEKSKVDEQYLAMGMRMLDDAFLPAFATHDPQLIKALRAHADHIGADKDCFEFQMLYGIARETQEELRAAGYRVRIYVPWGDSWYPYFSRRLAERPANLMFILRSIFKG